MELVHALMDQVHGPGPQIGWMDQGSIFCTFPLVKMLVSIMDIQKLVSLQSLRFAYEELFHILTL